MDQGSGIRVFQQPQRAIRGLSDIADTLALILEQRPPDQFLEEVVGYFGRLLSSPESAEPEGPSDAFDPKAQLLSPEEIAAFQEP